MRTHLCISLGVLAAITALTTGAVLAAGISFHTSPDRWEEPRNFHSPFDMDFDSRISMAQKPLPAPSEAPRNAQISPNKAYWAFSIPPERTEPGPWDESVLVFSERDSVLVLTFKEVGNYDARVEWVNEKLLFIRIWWGRVLGTDLILDVESESFVYREMLHEGTIAFQQWQEQKGKE